MKKTLATMLALIMIFATIAVTFVTSSAAEAGDDYIMATLNDIEFDGDLTITKGKNHELVDGKVSPEIKTMGTPHLAEYALSVSLENASIGAAYSIEKGELYIGVYGLEELYTITVTAGGVEFVADPMSNSVEGGEGYAQVASSGSAFAYEIIIPLNEIEIEKTDRGLVTDFAVTTEGGEEGSFDGQLFFSKYAAGFVYDALNKSAGMMLHANSVENGDGTVNVVNDGSETRVYAIPYVPNLTKNLVMKFDLTVNSMPKSNVEDTEGDAPGKWAQTAAPRLWIALKYRYAENLYMNIQNTADDGIVLNVYENYNDGFNTVKAQHTIVLDKETGDAMNLEFEWSEADADGKFPLNVYVDGVLKGTVANSMNIDPGLGNVAGVLQFNAQWTKTDATSETIDVTWGNISINEISALYNEAAYNAMADGVFGENGTEGGNDDETNGGNDDETDGGNGEGTTPPVDEEDDDKAPATTDDKKDDDAKDEEKKGGCGSSVAGIGLVAVLGTALTAVVATKKKED